jgi:hypothetical protein
VREAERLYKIALSLDSMDADAHLRLGGLLAQREKRNGRVKPRGAEQPPPMSMKPSAEEASSPVPKSIHELAKKTCDQKVAEANLERARSKLLEARQRVDLERARSHMKLAALFESGGP